MLFRDAKQLLAFRKKVVVNDTFPSGTNADDALKACVSAYWEAAADLNNVSEEESETEEVVSTPSAEASFKVPICNICALWAVR
jgi:hypothetical protein